MKRLFKTELFLPALFATIFVVCIIIWGIFPEKSKSDIKIVDINRSELNYGSGTSDEILRGHVAMGDKVYEYNSLELRGAKVVPENSQKPMGLVIKAKSRIIIDQNSLIDYSGAGYISEGSQGDNDYAGDGGASANPGGSGRCDILSRGSSRPISVFERSFGYSGGQGKNILGTEGLGGGYILLTAPEIIIDGNIFSKGLDGKGSGGGGGGGKIVLLSDKIIINGKIVATGGAGGSSQIQGAGGGGGGEVIISASESMNKSINVGGGLGGIALDIYTGCQGQNGFNGVIVNLKISNV